MTLTTTTSRVSYPGAGSAGPFAFPFTVTLAADLLVTKRSATGLETTLLNPANYTVLGLGTAAGSVTLTAALQAGETLFIRRAPALTQGASIRNQGSYFPQTIEDALDSMEMQLQSLQDGIARSAKLKETVNALASGVELEPTAGYVLTGTGTGFTMSPLSSGAVALPGAGRTTGTLSAYLLNNAVYNVMDFGAIADGVTDDTAKFQATHDAIGVLGGIIYAPGNRRYLLNKMTLGAQFTISKSKITLMGDGWSTVLLHTTVGASDSSFNGVVTVRAITGSITDIRILNLAILGPTTNNGSVNPVYAPNYVAGIAVGGSAEGNAYDTSNVEIAGSSITGIDGPGIAIVGSAGLNFNGVKGIRIHHNRIANCRDRGVNPLGANVFDFKCDNNVITQCDSIGINSGATGQSVTDNDISFVTHGIVVTCNNLAGLSDTHHTLIAGNRITDCGTVGVANGMGIIIDAEAAQDIQNVAIISNLIRRCGGPGINGTGSTAYKNVSILSNTIQDVGKQAVNTWSGIAINPAATVTDVEIANNNIVNQDAAYSMKYGIDCAVPGQSPTIHNNRILGAVTAPINASTTAIVFGNSENGVHVASHTGPNLVLVNGANENVVLPSGGDVFVISGPTGPFSLGGIAGGIDGRRITLLSTLGQTWTLLHGSGGSLAANQLRTGTGTVSPSISWGRAQFRYYGGAVNVWHVEDWV